MSHFPPRLRNDLKIVPLSEKGESVYIIEDPLSNTYYRIGQLEYRFLCFLDSGGDPAGLPESVEDNDNDAVTKEEAQKILQWLAAKQLLARQKPEVLQMVAENVQKEQHKNWLARFNFITFRLPLFNPDPLLNRCMLWIGWLAGPVFLAIWLIAGVAAVLSLMVHWPRFIGQGAGFFSFSNLCILALIWISLKVLHELSHALACRRYGGKVYEMGVLFILFIPLTYVNASSSWSFPTRWQRIHVAVSGMYMELFVAWIALLYWAAFPGTAGALIAHNTVIVAGISSLLFNANPLMRFDGYYVLSDMTGIPNLYFRGLDIVRQYAKKWWLGIPLPEAVTGYSLFVKLYGVAVYLWRVLVLLTLAYLASKMFSGWGILLAIIALISWTYQPVISFFANIPHYKAANSRYISHLLQRAGIVAVLGGVLLFGVDWQKSLRIPAVVLFEKQYAVRAATSGFVEEIFVTSGQRVTAGQKLVVLRNEELESQLKEINLELAIVDLQLRQSLSEGKVASLQILEERKAVLEEKKALFEKDKEALSIKAPGDGMVVKRKLNSLLGVWTDKGDEILQIVSPTHKHLVASVDQNDIDAFRGREGEIVQVDMEKSGKGMFQGRLEKVTPQASRKLPHYSLAAPFGGPFDVELQQGIQDRNSDYQLYSPRFQLYVSIPNTVIGDLLDGQYAVVVDRGIKRSPGAIIWRAVSSWFFARSNRDAAM